MPELPGVIGIVYYSRTLSKDPVTSAVGQPYLISPVPDVVIVLEALEFCDLAKFLYFSAIRLTPGHRF